MKLFDWRSKTWRRHAVVILTVIVVFTLASHPELRLLAPLVDVLGIDLLFILMGAQVVNVFASYVQPICVLLSRRIFSILSNMIISMFFFVFRVATGEYMKTLLADKYYSFAVRSG